MHASQNFGRLVFATSRICLTKVLRARRNFMIIGSAISLAVFVAACSKSPSAETPETTSSPQLTERKTTERKTTAASVFDSVGQKAVSERINQDSQGNIKMVRFKKLNGIPSSELYTMEFEAEIEFLSDGFWASGPQPETAATYRFYSEEGILLPGKSVKKGERAKSGGSHRFRKTENGWQSID